MIKVEDIFEGAACSAVYPSDGMWYEAFVERKLTEEEAEQFAANDLRSNQARCVVRYKTCGEKKTVPIDYIRMNQEHQKQNLRKKEQRARSGGMFN